MEGDSTGEIDTIRWWSIMERSLTLSERLAGWYAPAADAVDAVADVRYRRWRERVAGGDNELFERRLRWDGLRPDEVRLALGTLRMPDHEDLPEWMLFLREVVREARRGHKSGRETAGADEPVAFEEVVRPFVRVARQELENRTSGLERVLLDSGWQDLERSLLRALSGLAGPALFAEFAATRTGFAAAGLRAGKQRYQAFVGGLLAGALLPFLERYAMLARLLATRTMSWVDRSAELLLRLDADLPVLRGGLLPADSTKRVRRVLTDLSDSHHGWRTVFILEFEGGSRIVYKPRSVGPEASFARLVGWLDARGASPGLLAGKVVARDGYGWMEYIRSESCLRSVEVDRYYERAGMLLCLVRLLGGGDFHHENVVAHGEFPVLIDLEVIHGARILTEQEVTGTEADTVSDLLWDSVCRTMLLPSDMMGPGGISYRGGGFGGGTAPVLRRTTWTHVNSDAMAQAVEVGPANFAGNLPVLDGVPVSSERYIDRIRHGYAAMHRLLIRERASLLAPDGPLGDAFTDSVRVIIRPTQAYAAVIARCTHPQFLTSGAEMGIELDVLSRARIRRGEEPPLFWKAYREELADLERLDIPVFVARTDDRQLRAVSGEPLAVYCSSPPRDDVRARLQRMGDADLRSQLRFISLSFQALARGRRMCDAPAAGDELSATQALEEARSIASQLDALAQQTSKGRVWFGIVQLADRADLQDLGDGLYLGSAGPAVLHAALFALTRESAHRAASEACLQRLLSRLGSRSRRAVRRLQGDGYGAGGLAGKVYALTLCAHLLENPALRVAAETAARHLRPPSDLPPDRHDLVAGSAGAVLALLAVYRLTGDRLLLEQSRAWADKLACGGIGGRNGDRTLGNSSNGLRRTGLGKGAAGVGHALLEAFRETLQPAYLDGAAQAWEFVGTRTKPGSYGWITAAEPEVTDNGPVQRAWCLGSSGIGLASAAATDILSGMATNVENAVQDVRRLNGTGVVDNCCCGRAGHLELMLHAARSQHRPDLRREAAGTAAAMVNRARRRGFYVTGFGNAYAPGFFKGLAGIGYQLLRLHHSDRLPSILLLETAHAG